MLDWQIQSWLADKLNITNTIAENIATAQSPEQLRKMIDFQIGKEAFQLFYFVSQTTGEPIFNSQGLILESVDGRNRDWYKQAIDANTAILTAPYTDETSDYPMISAVAKVSHQDNLVGVVGGDISTQTISEVMNHINFNNAGYVFLSNDQGNIIIHPDIKLYDQSVKQTLPGLNIHDTTTFQSVIQGDKELLVKLMPTDVAGDQHWIIGLVLDRDVVFKEVDTLATRSIIAAIISVLLSSLLLYMFMKQAVIKPIQVLTEKANDISMGKINDEIGDDYRDRKDEIGALARGFERMRKSLALAMRKIRNKN